MLSCTTSDARRTRSTKAFGEAMEYQDETATRGVPARDHRKSLFGAPRRLCRYGNDARPVSTGELLELAALPRYQARRDVLHRQRPTTLAGDVRCLRRFLRSVQLFERGVHGEPFHRPEAPSLEIPEGGRAFLSLRGAGEP